MADTRLVWREGVYAGLVGGCVLGVLEIVASAASGPLVPVRMAASVFLGRSGLEGRTAGHLFVGVVVHLALSLLFGLWYGALTLRFSPKSRRSFGFQAGLGLLYGVLVWAVNFQLLARLFFPWFLRVPQFQQALLHAVGFGLPLALAYELAQRRVEAPAGEPRRA
jgi:hypothetical protein